MWKRKKHRAPKLRRELEERIVYCLNCEVERPLTTNASGQAVCSVCAGDSWHHGKAPLAAGFKEYHEKPPRWEDLANKAVESFSRIFRWL